MTKSIDAPWNLLSERSRRLLVLSLALLASAVAATACSGNGGGDDDDHGTAEFAEVEPNDSRATANDIGSAASFEGDCNDLGSDFFGAAISQTGTFAVSLQYDQGGGAVATLHLYDSEGTLLDIDTDFDEDGSAETSAAVSSAGIVSIEVGCFAAQATAYYLGTVTRP